MTSRPPPRAVPWMADTTGFGELSIRSSTEWSDGSVGGLPNSVMSAPAMKVRPAHTMTIACTAPSAVACLIPSCSPFRTCWLSALTGGLSTVSTATRPRLPRSTDWVIFAMWKSSEPKVAPMILRNDPPGSAAQPRGEIDEVSSHDVPLARGFHVLRLTRAVLRRPRHERRAQAERARRREVAVVRGDHHALAWRQPEERGRRQVGLGLGLVVPRDLRAEDGVPREPTILRHVDDQRDVAVRERREDELLLEAREAGHGVGPGVEAVPGTVQVIDLGLREPLDGELGQELVEALAVEIVELRPRAPAAAHLVHRGLVEAAPRIGEPGPVHAEALRLAERLALADEARPPVHHRAEDIEGERFDVRDGHDFPLTVRGRRCARVSRRTPPPPAPWPRARRPRPGPAPAVRRRQHTRGEGITSRRIP